MARARGAGRCRSPRPRNRRGSRDAGRRRGADHDGGTTDFDGNGTDVGRLAGRLIAPAHDHAAVHWCDAVTRCTIDVIALPGVGSRGCEAGETGSSGRRPSPSWTSRRGRRTTIRGGSPTPPPSRPMRRGRWSRMALACSSSRFRRWRRTPSSRRTRPRRSGSALSRSSRPARRDRRRRRRMSGSRAATPEVLAELVMSPACRTGCWSARRARRRRARSDGSRGRPTSTSGRWYSMCIASTTSAVPIASGRGHRVGDGSLWSVELQKSLDADVDRNHFTAWRRARAAGT